MRSCVPKRFFGVSVSTLCTHLFLASCVLSLVYFAFIFVTLLRADADVIDPDGNGTTLGTVTTSGCGAGGRYDCLNDGVATSSTPDSSTDYVQHARDGMAYYQMETIGDVATATEVRINVFHIQNSANLRFDITLYNSAGTSTYGATTSLTIRGSAQWDTATFSGLTLTQAQLDGMQVRMSCVRDSGGTTQNCRAFAMYADVVYDRVIETTVGTTSTQQNVNASSTNAYIGGAFTITENVSSRNITSITIAENGTIDAQNNLKNIKLFYELDTSAPYNCASETYGGSETQYGSTVAGGFTSGNGTANFTGSVGISTTSTMCVYVVVDVQSGASAGQTIEVYISDPSTLVVASGGADVRPTTAVNLEGTTTVLAPRLDQMHYHWRNDDNSEALATSATGNAEDTAYDTLSKLAPTRLRIEVSNEGNADSTTTQFRIEYAKKTTTCAAISSWTDVGDTGGDWNMYNSSNLTEGANTTNIAVSTGGVTDENVSFIVSNGGVRDTTSQTSGIVATSTQFIELEYSIVSTNLVTEGDTYCFRVSNAGTALHTYTRYPEATILADVIVTSSGTQRTTIDIPTSNVSVGGMFIITDNIAGNTSITSITVAASGTVDYQNDLSNLRLYYDLDTSNPYNCVSESYGGGESQYGSTISGGFNGSALAVFSGSATVNTSQTLCVYFIFDVESGVSNAETFDIKINNPSTDVIIGSGTVAPNSLVSIDGMTTFVLDMAVQTHYHWRNDNGSETGATSATEGVEDTARDNLRLNLQQRLRIAVHNEGSSTTPAYQYRLEYGLRTATCNAISTWVNVSDSGGAFDMYNSSNITDGGNTTNIATSTGGVTDNGGTFLVSNAGLKDTSSQTGNITLLGNELLELEYSIITAVDANQGSTYCLRVTNAGTPIDAYDVYPEVEIKPKTDFNIQRGIFTMTGTSQTLTAGTDYIAPQASTSAFMQITNTLNTGGGGGTAGNADDVTVYISNPSNIMTSITFTRPGAATGNTRVAWELIEYAGSPGGQNEMIVRHQSTAVYGSGNTTVSSPSIAGITDDSQIVVFITGQLNPDTATNYQFGNSTASWNSASDLATFTRGTSGNASEVSYVVAEFVGANWQIQRIEHNYSSAGTVATTSITAVNSLSRTFIHTQKRMGAGQNTHGDFSHEIWLSSIGLVSHKIDSTATTPNLHYSVVWIIENTQTAGTAMIVTRANGTNSGGTPPLALNTNIGRTLPDMDIASIFMNNTGTEPGGGGGQNSFPEPMMSARIISTTQFELGVQDTNDSRTWRAEVVEWPTAARKIEQNYYRFYVDNNTTTPSDPWPTGGSDVGENTEITGSDGPIAGSGVTRLRMTLHITEAGMNAGIDSFKLQYAQRSTSCSAIAESNWYSIGDSSSTTVLWRGYNAAPSDGVSLSGDPPTGGHLLISVSDVAGSYEESNDSALTPYDVDPNQDVEFDWILQNYSAPQKADFCFRMIEAGGILLSDYNFYPVMRTAGYSVESKNWRWYDDGENETPSSPMANENIAPIDVAFDDTLKLRISLREYNGGNGNGAKFRLQYSESPTFSSVVNVAEIGDCEALDYWCYTNGGGTDNATITTAVLTDAGTCSGGVGAGCGSHNESGTSSSTSQFVQYANSTADFSFTLRNAGARVNRVYYFRVYDLLNNEVVPLGSGETYPSLTSDGASLDFSLTGLNSGTVVESVTLDVTTTPTSIPFGTVPINTFVEGAHRLTIDTNGTEGYQLFMNMSDDLLNSFGSVIQQVSGTNATPNAWNTGCASIATSCFGYHTSDDTLYGGSTRFSAVDTWARVSTTTLDEVGYSSQPGAGDDVDVVFRILVRQMQHVGEYEANIQYVSVPIF